MLRTATKRADVDYDQLAEQLLQEIANDYPEDLEVVIGWLQQAASTRDAIEALVKFKFPPVGPREFVEGKSYMDKAGTLWPKVMDEFEKMNSGRYVESVLTGAIGVAKTTIALYTQAYQLYLLSCLRNPHEEFDLDAASEIVIIFQSLNAKLAKDVDYQRFRDMIATSPYFARQFPYDLSRESEMRFPNRIIVKPISGQDTGAIGQNVIGGVIDEINFMAVVENSKANRDGATYDQAVQNYNSIARRRESRFMNKGSLPGMLCLVSSRNYPGQFTDVKEKEARTNPRIFIYDKRLWEIRPERFSGDKFRVFTGDETRKPRLLDEDDVVSPEESRLVMAIPVEYRNSFEADILKSLRDIAGVATQALHPFMLNTDAVSNCFGRVQSIASRDDCDFTATRVKLLPSRIVNSEEPRFAHIDLSLSKDSAGIAIGHVPRFEHMNRGDHVETLPVIQFDMLLEVAPPRGGEIIFDNIRRLLYVLRDDLKLPLKYVSFDQFQSKDSMQILHQAGFMVGYRSMDVDTYAYDMTKQAFYDGRILAPTHKKALTELTRLEIDPKKRKIDHPPNGSKDIADALAGVVIGLTLRRELWVRHGVPLIRIPKSITQMKTGRHDAPEALANDSYIDRVRAARGLARIEA
jgi:hypothetical protein